ncbi:pilus assembly protein PilP [Thermodesulfovibrionales bacterium]|nr:pilus assembly protein PilP [Thermodesulfovibrionales bacterium]
MKKGIISIAVVLGIALGGLNAPPDALGLTSAYAYTASGRDPFVPLIIRKVDPVPVVDPAIVEVICPALAGFRLIGIVWDDVEKMAVIILPDGRSQIIREGDELILHEGKVHKIMKDSITIREYVMDDKGVFMPKDITLKLRKQY